MVLYIVFYCYQIHLCNLMISDMVFLYNSILLTPHTSSSVYHRFPFCLCISLPSSNKLPILSLTFPVNCIFSLLSFFLILSFSNEKVNLLYVTFQKTFRHFLVFLAYSCYYMLNLFCNFNNNHYY